MKKNLKKLFPPVLLLMLSLTGLLSGCATNKAPQPTHTASGKITTSTKITNLKKAIAYYNIAIHLPKNIATENYRQYTAELKQQHCSDKRIKAILLLTNPELATPGKEALNEMLEPCLNQSNYRSKELGPLFQLLALQLAEKTNQQKQQQALRQEIKALNEQMDALKAIEKSIHQRDLIEQAP